MGDSRIARFLRARAMGGYAGVENSPFIFIIYSTMVPQRQVIVGMLKEA